MFVPQRGKLRENMPPATAGEFRAPELLFFFAQSRAQICAAVRALRCATKQMLLASEHFFTNLRIIIVIAQNQ